MPSDRAAVPAPATSTWRAGPWQLHVQWPAGITPPRESNAPLAADGPQLAITVQMSPDLLHFAEHPQFRSWTDDRCTLEARRAVVEVDWRSRAATWHMPMPSNTGELEAFFAGAAMGTLIALAMRVGGLFMHGAALALGGQAVVVTGPSGAGKSTLSERFPNDYLHDDMCMVAPGREGWDVWYQDLYRAPLRAAPATTPLAAIFLLGSDRTQTRRRAVGPGQAMAGLLRQSYYPGPMAAKLMTQNLANLLEFTPVYELAHCLTDDRLLLESVLFGDAGHADRSNHGDL